MRPSPAGPKAPAAVLGNADLLWPLAAARIPTFVFAPPGDPVRWSRKASGRLPWVDPHVHPERLVEILLDFARTQPEAPVLMPQGDPDLLAVSRHRDRLREVFRFLLPPADVVERLVDKAQFIEWAEMLDLPVPATQRLAPSPDADRDLMLRFPVVLKPAVRRDDLWQTAVRAGKALHVDGPEDLAAIWPRIAELGLDILAQEVVPGPESRVESYHAYADEHGRIVAAFTGRKIRTRPSRYGHSTAVEITAAADVADLGAELMQRLGLVGVAKFDFKRAPDGRLHLLEVNPRFTLWHHPAAVAGMNIPDLMHADLTGRTRPEVRPARAGVTWCKPPTDFLTVRDEGGDILRWARWAARCPARYSMSWSDPLPVVPGWGWAALRPHVAGSRKTRPASRALRRIGRRHAR